MVDQPIENAEQTKLVEIEKGARGFYEFVPIES